MKDIQGRVAVVTGAASGIGFATARRFAEEGMHVVMADFQEDALDAAAASLSEAGHDVLGVRTDVSRYEQVEQLAERARCLRQGQHSPQSCRCGESGRPGSAEPGGLAVGIECRSLERYLWHQGFFASGQKVR